MKHRNLASERIRLGMNQTICAEKLDVSVKQLVKYESNAGDMPADFVKRAADFFGCSADYLLDMTDDRLPKTVAIAD